MAKWKAGFLAASHLAYLFIGLHLLGSTPAKAVVFYSSGDTTKNTTAPTGLGGNPADAGWQWVGLWGMYQAAPIGPHHFLAANHVGGNVGDTFTYQGLSYTTVKSYTDGSSDLRIWEVREAFPSWAPLFRTETEIGTSVVIGRGVTRGDEVLLPEETWNLPAGYLVGWYWGNYDGVLRWGTNSISSFTSFATLGPQIVYKFNQDFSDNECNVGIYDSSSPVFIKDGSDWKLAGVISSVDAGYSLTSGGPTINAFLFDRRGLFSGTYQYVGTKPLPGIFYATRVSSRISWIDSILALPLTCTVALGNLNQTYSAAPRPVLVTTTPGIPATVTYNGSTTIPFNAGTYAVVATAAGSNGGYNYAGSASGSLVVAKASQTISFNPLPDATVGQAQLILYATATSDLPIAFSSSNTSVASVSGSFLTIVGAGTATITATQSGNSNYNPAPNVFRSITVSPLAADAPLPQWASFVLAACLACYGITVLNAAKFGRLTT
jgi:hypothetical protein